MATNEPERFSMELDDKRRELLREVKDKLEENTKTASVVKSLHITLDWIEKREEAIREKEEIEERWEIDG